MPRQYEFYELKELNEFKDFYRLQEMFQTGKGNRKTLEVWSCTKSAALLPDVPRSSPDRARVSRKRSAANPPRRHSSKNHRAS